MKSADHFFPNLDVELCQGPLATILSLHPDIPWFRSTRPASYMFLTHLADHIRSVLLADFPFHVAVFDFTRVEIVLVVLVIAISARALHS